MPRVEAKFCHHCHTKKECAVCDSAEGEGCAKSYCGTCIEKYGTTLEEVRKEDPWKCFGCRNECLCTGCRKRGRSTAEPVVPSIHPKFIAWFEAAGIEGDSSLLRYPGPPPELPSVAESQQMAEQGLPEPLCPNVWAKPFVPARLNLASSAYRGVSSQGNRFRARICVNKTEYTICDAETEEEAAKAYDLESLRFGKVRFLNFVYRGINDALLPPGLEDVLRKAGKLTAGALSGAVAYRPAKTGGAGSGASGSASVSPGTASAGGSGRKGKSGAGATAGDHTAAGRSGKKGMPAGRAATGSLSFDGVQSAPPPAKRSRLSKGTTLTRHEETAAAMLARNTTSTQTSLRPAQLPGLFHSAHVSDSDILSSAGGSTGFLSPSADIERHMGGLGGLSCMGMDDMTGGGLALDGGSGYRSSSHAQAHAHAYPFAALLPSAGRQWEMASQHRHEHTHGHGSGNKRRRSQEPDEHEDEATEEHFEPPSEHGHPVGETLSMRGWPSAASLLGLGLGLSPQAAMTSCGGGGGVLALALAPMHPRAGAGTASDDAHPHTHALAHAHSAIATSLLAAGVTPQGMFAALASSDWASEGEAMAASMAGEGSGAEAGASVGGGEGDGLRMRTYTRLLSFVASARAQSVLSPAQAKKFKQMVVTGGRNTLALLCAAADAFDRACSASASAGAGRVSGQGARDIDGGLHLMADEADEEDRDEAEGGGGKGYGDGMGGRDTTDASSGPSGGGLSMPRGGSMPTLTISEAGSELIDTLATCYKLWLDVGRLYGLVQLRTMDTGRQQEQASS